MSVVDELLGDLGTTEVKVSGRDVPLKIPDAEQTEPIWAFIRKQTKGKGKSNDSVLIEATIRAMMVCLDTDRERASKLLALQSQGLLSPLAVACRRNCGFRWEDGGEANPTAA